MEAHNAWSGSRFTDIRWGPLHLDHSLHGDTLQCRRVHIGSLTLTVERQRAADESDVRQGERPLQDSKRQAAYTNDQRRVLPRSPPRKPQSDTGHYKRDDNPMLDALEIVHQKLQRGAEHVACSDEKRCPQQGAD